MARSLICAAVLSLSLASTGVAAAAEWVPKAQGSRVVGELEWWPTDNLNVISMGVAVQIKLARAAYLDLDFPWAFADPDVGDTVAVFGNPTVGAHWADSLNNRFSAYVGGTFTVATMFSDDDSILDFDYDDRLLTRVLATANRGYADFHRFLPDYIFIRARGGIELRIVPVLYYRLDVSPLIAIPVGEFVDDVEAFMDIHNELEARGRSGVGGGVHFQAVFNTARIRGDNDAAQLAIEPYFVYDPGRGFYARIGSLIALDEPLGFGFEDGKVASLRVTLGGRW